MMLYPKNSLPVTEVKKFILIFFTFAIAGFLIPYTRNLFILITPFALLINVYLLGIYHKIYSTKAVLLFLTIFLFGYGIEVIGVQTGKIFGSYRYGSALGIKLFETPLLIGINWLFISYLTVSVCKRLLKNRGLIIFAAPLMMLAYDFVLEQIAPKIDMWHWQHTVVPLQNYLAWYIIGTFFTVLLVVFRLNTENPLALILLSSQFLFFVLLTFMIH